MTTSEEVREKLRAGYRRSGQHRGILLGAALASAIETHPTGSVTFLGKPSEELSLGALLSEGRGLSSVLRQRGVTVGEAVAIQLPNSRRSWLIYLACMMAGAVIVPIPPEYGSHEVGFILVDSGARTYFVPDRWRRMDYISTLSTLRRAPRLESIVVVGDDVPSDCMAIDDLERQAATVDTMPAVIGDASGLCMVCYTSGSTAQPKGVQHSHDTLVAELVQTQEAFPEVGVTLTARPLGTVAGVLSLMRTLFLGGDAVVMERWDAPIAAEIVRDRRVTLFQPVPIMLTTLLDEAEQRSIRLDSLQNVSVGGTTVPPSIIDRAERMGVHVYRVYGSTEHPTVTSGHGTEDLGVRAGTDGLPLRGVTVRIVDEEGRELAVGLDGEVVTRGPDQFLGYTDPTATAEAFSPDGWFRTGDIGHLTTSGRLVMSDRKKDIIIRAGMNLSAAAIEEVLARHPSVAEVAAVGLPDPLYGERPAAFVVLRPGTSLSLSDVQRHFEQAGVARQKTPELLVVKTALPRSEGGKVAKQVLRRELQGASSAASGDASPDTTRK